MKNTQIQIGQCASRYLGLVADPERPIGRELDALGVPVLLRVRRR